MSNIGSLRNYASQHIYKNIIIRYPHLTTPEITSKIQSTYKTLINNIRYITTSNEVDTINMPMSFLFHHIKQDIVSITANCVCINDKLFLDKYLIYNFDWNIRLFKCLKSLKALDIIVWFFLHIPYFNNDNTITPLAQQQHAQQHTQQNTQYILLYEKLLDYFLIHWTPDIYLTENEFIFISNDTCMPYALSYYYQYNNTNVNIFVKYCKLLRQICPWLNYYSPNASKQLFTNMYTNTPTQTPTQTPTTTSSSNPTSNPSPTALMDNDKDKIKICFISDSFNTDTSVLRDRISIIGKLDRTKYDVYFASFIPFENIYGIIAKTFMNKIKSNYIYLGSKVNTNYNSSHPSSLLTSAREILETYNFNYIVYPDLGMKLLPTLLAYSRIALKQITTWGHSVTSGIDTIDYYISSNYFELPIELSQKHYSEKLILLKSLGTFYISPHKLFITKDNKHKQLTKGELGFKDITNIYCCLQTFYKINKQFEQCLLRILQLDPNACILLSNTFPYCKSHLKRIKNIMTEAQIKRLKWYPSLEKAEFLNLVKISNVCLDPFPFGGCNTSYDAFDYNIPVITMPNQYLYNRFTLGLYTKMNLSDCECIVNNIEEYANIATQICLNIKLQHKINRNIEMNKHLIFQDMDSINDWNNLFITL